MENKERFFSYHQLDLYNQLKRKRNRATKLQTSLFLLEVSRHTVTLCLFLIAKILGNSELKLSLLWVGVCFFCFFVFLLMTPTAQTLLSNVTGQRSGYLTGLMTESQTNVCVEAWQSVDYAERETRSQNDR